MLTIAIRIDESGLALALLQIRDRLVESHEALRLFVVALVRERIADIADIVLVGVRLIRVRF